MSEFRDVRHTGFVALCKCKISETKGKSNNNYEKYTNLLKELYRK
jgi:hypothetical protein